METPEIIYERELYAKRLFKERGKEGALAGCEAMISDYTNKINALPHFNADLIDSYSDSRHEWELVKQIIEKL